MSRFSNLEFGDVKREPAKPGEAGTPIRNADHFFNLAEKSYLAGDFEMALRNYSRALEQDSAFYEGWFGQVRMLIDLGEYEEAFLWTNKALELFPEQPELLAAKGLARCRSGDLDGAMAYTDNALARKGVTSFVWLVRAEVLMERRSAAAANCLSNAISMAGNTSARMRLEAGRLLNRFGQCLAAMEHLKIAVNGLPQSALAWLELGRAQAALGLPQAEVTLSQCLTLRPGWEEARDALDYFQQRGIFSRLGGFFRRLRGG